MLGGLKKFDAYPKTLEDFRIKTLGGGAVTIACGIFIIVLCLWELTYYLSTEIQSELLVDATRGQKVRIDLDTTFFHMPCALLSIDAMDVSGEQQLEIDHDIYKQRIDEKGNKIEDEPEKGNLGGTDINPQNSTVAPTTLSPDRCESCYGAETAALKCCNTCNDVREAYRRRGWAFTMADEVEQCKREGYSNVLKEQEHEGCRVSGFLLVSKVAGNFHFAPGKSFQQNHIHVHDIQAFQRHRFNLTHQIHRLSFGRDYPGIVNPLDESMQIATKDSTMFQYFVKIVPTTYENLEGEVSLTNQFSVTLHEKLGGTLPGVFFIYEMAPMMVKYTEKQRSFMHFLTGLCAIVGGVFTVAGLIDALIYHSARAIQKKIELGKAS